jgi:hypothetical protein
MTTARRQADIAALFQTTNIPRETLLRSLAIRSWTTGSDGVHLLTRPHEVLIGNWLTAAQAQIDQLNAKDRDKHDEDDSTG